MMITYQLQTENLSIPHQKHVNDSGLASVLATRIAVAVVTVRFPRVTRNARWKQNCFLIHS